MRKSRLLLGLVASTAWLVLSASAAEPGTVPERAAWTIEIFINGADRASSATGPRRPVKIESTKTGKVKHDSILFSDGSREDYWFAQGFAFSLNPDGKSASALEYSNLLVGENESGASPAFPGLAWVKGKQPAESLDRGGKQILHFLRESIPVGTPLLQAVTEVWIDPATGLPLEAITPVATHRYTHHNPPTTDLTIPPVFRQAVDQAVQRAARRETLSKAFESNGR
ncbi:MAG: hypothetical protein Fur0032_23560 [Terrimicrobiaceae bacterium]